MQFGSRPSLLVAALAVASALPGHAAADGPPPTPPVPPAPAPPPALLWQAPTPATGTAYTTKVGATLSLTLVASEQTTGPTIGIRAAGTLPDGFKVVVTNGNPAAAVFSWTPTARQAGTYSLSFTAGDDQSVPLAAPTLTYQITVVPPPAPAVVKLKLSQGSTSRWAMVLRATTARVAPSASARAVTQLATITPDDTQNVVLLLDEWSNDSSDWVHVRLPILPNNSTGWVPRSALGAFYVVNTHLYVNVELMTATLYANGQLVFRTHVGVGRPYWPTPKGEFYVRDKLVNFGDPFYGPVAFGTSARSAVLTDWPGGGYVGIHGTNEPQILPGRVSHGCIRMTNDAILRLSRLMPVGTPVTVI
jgi:lipoprotein-anchoring transpeptidase ErfK/SrfK